MAANEDPGAIIDVSGDGGVTKVIKKEGSGTDTPCEGSTVYVHYVGTLLDGQEFDSSRERGKPFDFVLGPGKELLQFLNSNDKLYNYFQFYPCVPEVCECHARVSLSPR